jgi:hypothetical protein
LLQNLFDPLLDFHPRQGGVDDQRFGDDIVHALVRVERRPWVLEHGLHRRPVLAQGVATQRVHVLAVDEDLAGRGLLQAQDELRGGRLAAAGFADDGERLALGDREVDAVHGLDPADHARPEHALGDREVLRQAVSAEDRLGRHSASSLQQSAECPSPTTNDGGYSC